MNKKQNIILILFGAVVAVIFVVLIGRNLIIKSSIGPAVRGTTGFDASVRDLDVGLFSSKIVMKDLQVFNPPDFGEKLMMEAPEIYVEYQLGSMMSDRREFPEIRINVAQVVVVKTAKGESNVARMMAAKPKSEGEGGKAPGKGSGTVNHFGLLDLTLSKVTMVDYTKMNNGQPQRKELTLNFHQTYRDVLDKDLKRIIMLETLRNLPFKLPDATPEMLQQGLTAAVGTGMNVATNLVGGVSDAVKGVGGLFQPKTNAAPKSR